METGKEKRTMRRINGNKEGRTVKGEREREWEYE